MLANRYKIPMTARNFFKEALRGFRRRHIQLSFKIFDTYLILPHRQAALALSLITLHQATVSLLMAIIQGQYFLAQRNRCGVVVSLQTVLAQAVRQVEV